MLYFTTYMCTVYWNSVKAILIFKMKGRFPTSKQNLRYMIIKSVCPYKAKLKTTEFGEICIYTKILCEQSHIIIRLSLHYCLTRYQHSITMPAAKRCNCREWRQTQDLSVHVHVGLISLSVPMWELFPTIPLHIHVKWWDFTVYACTAETNLLN